LITVISFSIISKIRSFEKLPFELIPVSGLMIWNIQSYLELGGFENTLSTLFYFSIILWIASIVVGIWKTASRVTKAKPEVKVHKSKPKKPLKKPKKSKKKISRK